MQPGHRGVTAGERDRRVSSRAAPSPGQKGRVGARKTRSGQTLKAVCRAGDRGDPFLLSHLAMPSEAQRPPARGARCPCQQLFSIQAPGGRREKVGGRYR